MQSPASPLPPGHRAASPDAAAAASDTPPASAQCSILNPGSQSQNRKRKYTLTEKALAANRANLVKARQVPKEIRFRHTERREAAARLALACAREAKRLRHAAGIDPNIRHGHTLADPCRALVMLGRKREEYEALRELWRQSFPASNQLQGKLVEGLGQAAWRRLQLYRSQAIDEALLFKARLMLAPRVMGQAMARLGSEPGNEAMLGEMKRLEGALAGLVVETFSLDPEFEQRLGRADRRVERLLRLYLAAQQQGQGFVYVARNLRQDFGLLKLHPQAMGNAFVWARALEERRHSPASGAAGEGGVWNWLGAEARHGAREQELTELTLQVDDLNRPILPLRLIVDDGRRVFDLGEGAPRQALWVEDHPEVSAAGWQVGEWPQAEERELLKELRVDWVQSGQTERLPVGGVEDCLGLVQAVMGGEPRALAEAAWKRLQVYWERAAEEERRLLAILKGEADAEAVATPRGGEGEIVGWHTPLGGRVGQEDSREAADQVQPGDGAPRPQGEAGAIAVQRHRAEHVMSLLTRREDTRFRVEEATAHLKGAWYDWFERRYGQQPEFYRFLPERCWTDPRERSHLLETLSILYPELEALLESQPQRAGPA